MKKTFTFLLLGLVMHFIPGRNEATAQIPPEFTGSLFNNPVLYFGYSGSWDEYTLIGPSVFIHEGIFYMFYTGFNGDVFTSIGLASSSDGYVYEKYLGNPVMTHSASGFDSQDVNGPVVIEDASGWIMYYAGRESGYGPSPSAGRATAQELTGPWTRSPDPVLTIGDPEDWDNDFLNPFQVLPIDSGGYIMFYTAGNYSSNADYQIGMATSMDGLVWTKYNDSSTIDPPYENSDPVLKVGSENDWDGRLLWGGSAIKNPDGYEMYYSAASYGNDWGFGYATSPDGIIWTKYQGNPVYTLADDPYGLENGATVIVRPYVIINDQTAFMYYDYGMPGVIAMATGLVTGMEDHLAVGSRQSAVSSYPNPTYGIFNVQFTVYYLQRVSLKIYDVQGREVAVVLDAKLPAGEHTVSHDVSMLPAGVYFYRLTTDDRRLTTTGKMVKY